MKTDREAPQASRRKTAIAETGSEKTGSNRPDGRISEMDRAAGFEIGPDFTRFDQINDIFSRAFWDDRVKSADTDAFFDSYRRAPAPRRADGFTQRDFAFRNAAWVISDMVSERGGDRGLREGFQALIEPAVPIALDAAPLGTAAEESRSIKAVAKRFGADLVGIAEIDLRWHYATRVDVRDFSKAPNELPDGMTHVIVMAHEMAPELVATYPSALAGAATGMEYSHEAAIAIQLASYIRHLGYDAVASMNDTALAVPYAIQAGLGEYGRNQMVLTPEYGPRVRFSKVFTSLPLAADAPRRLGLHDYCQSCTRCADSCPPRALPFGGPEEGGDSPSTIRGVRKWSANCEKCFGFWAKLRSDCAICMRVCPFNRSYDRFADRLWRRLATGRWRALARWWAERWAAERRTASDWWKGAGDSNGGGG